MSEITEPTTRSAIESATESESAEVEVEAWLLGALRELGLEAGGPQDDFFELGGTSLTAMRLIAKAEERFGEDALPPDELYERPGLRQIAAGIARNAAVAPAAAADGR
jgi:acyl carrier protein